MDFISVELTNLFENMKKEIKENIIEAIRTEIANLNIAEIIRENNKQFEQLKQENGELREIIIKLKKEIESNKRKNNLIFFGIKEDKNENFEKIENVVLDVCNNKLLVEFFNKSRVNYVRRFGRDKDKIRPVLVSCVSKIDR